MIDIAPDKYEREVRRLLAKEIDQETFMAPVRQLVADGNVREAIRCLLPLAKRRADYVEAVWQITYDPNNKMTMTEAMNEKNHVSRYDVEGRTLREALNAIKMDIVPDFDRPTYAFAKYMLFLLMEGNQNVGKAYIEEVLRFARENPVPPEILEDRRVPRRAGTEPGTPPSR